MEWKKSIDESWKEAAEKEKDQLESMIQGGSRQKTAPQGRQTSANSTSEPSSRPPGDAGGKEADISRQATPEGAEEEPAPESEGSLELNFLNYVTSLAFQAMVFLGEILNPVTNETEQNLPQAKFVIDTLVMLRGKTKGNLTKKESDMLNATAYELQMKYVELASKEGVA